MSIKQIAQWALNATNQQGVSYADARIVDERDRGLATKNGKVGHASDSASLGLGIRVLANGAWGFAATEDLTRAGVESTAAKAVEIARSSAIVKQEDVRLAPEKAFTDEWTTPIRIDPFTKSIEENLELLLNVDKELRAVQGITLAETNMNFRRYEQWFFSSEGANIHGTKYTTGAGYAAFSFEGTDRKSTRLNSSHVSISYA